MSNATLQVLSGMSSVLGLLSTLAYFFTVAQARRTERSVREIVEGDPLFKADQIISILKLFKDDGRRLAALTKLAAHERKKAEDLLEKIKDQIDPVRLEAVSASNRLRVLGLAGALFVVLGALGFIWSYRSSGSSALPPPSQAAPGPVSSSGTSPNRTPDAASPASGKRGSILVDMTDTVHVTRENRAEFEERIQVGAGTLLLDGVRIRAPRHAVYLSNRLELKNGAEIVGDDFAVLTVDLVGGRLGVAGGEALPSTATGANGGVGRSGGRLLVAAARISGTQLDARGGPGAPGGAGAAGADGGPGANGSDGRCGPGILGQFHGSTAGGDGRPGAPGGRGGNGGDGGRGGEIILLSPVDVPHGLTVTGGRGGAGGAGGPGGRGGPGGHGGAGCSGAGGSQPTRPNGHDGASGVRGADGEPGRQGADGRLWYRRLDSIDQVIDIVRRSATTDAAREALIAFATR